MSPALAGGFFTTESPREPCFFVFIFNDAFSILEKIFIWLCQILVATYRIFVAAPHSSTLAWKIPLTEEPGRLQSMGRLRVGHD